MSKIKVNTGSMIAITVSGIPCYANVTHCDIQRPYGGSAQNCESDVDYYGYAEVEFDIYDRKGYPAKWLEKKLTEAEKDSIIDTIIEQH